MFLTPNGDSKGLYVVAKGPSTFEVHESGSGNSTLAFDYRVVAKRRGYEGQRLVDVTDQFQTETASMAKRIQLAQDAHTTRIKPPTPPAPHVVHTPRAAFAPQTQPALAVRAER